MAIVVSRNKGLAAPDATENNLSLWLDNLRFEANRTLDATQKAELGQIFTPYSIARKMASFYQTSSIPEHITLLDAGAGIGTLTAACIEYLSRQTKKPKCISVTAFEIDRHLLAYLELTLRKCQELCQDAQIEFYYEIKSTDFISESVSLLETGTLFSVQKTGFNLAILNPPYRKISNKSVHKKLLRLLGIETVNLYTAFMWLAAILLKPQGQFISITPRSFCNGPYFRMFRKSFLNELSLKHIHIFDSRTHTFDDNVLQENIILHGVKSAIQDTIMISTSADANDEMSKIQTWDYGKVVSPFDKEAFIHIVPDEQSLLFREQIQGLVTTLDDLNLSVSTGKVVDFRAVHLLRNHTDENVVPLIYPKHFVNGKIEWPIQNFQKPDAVECVENAKSLLINTGYYVLVKRFSSKEEKRRIVAAVYDPNQIRTMFIGLENLINYYHYNNQGLSYQMAVGLSAFLNSTALDQYFRQFSGHTQVNATDLRCINYPSEKQLILLGERVGLNLPEQNQLDRIVAEVLQLMPNKMSNNKNSIDPNAAKQTIAEAILVLKALKVPRGQQNERSAVTLLALLDMKPGSIWADASNPFYGITQMMDYFRDYFGISYQPNTRETVRRQTIHQFIQIGLVIENPDDPSRPINSPHTRYQIAPDVLELLKTFNSSSWAKNLAAFEGLSTELGNLSAKERRKTLIPVTLPDGKEVQLTAGGQNLLIKEIIEKFCPYFTPGGIVVYIGDAGQKLEGSEQQYLMNLGITIDEHGKMPDIIVH